MHVIDYKIHGDDMQFVEIELDPQEAVVAEAGGMMFMDEGIAMETIFGDGSNANKGFMGALLGAGKRLLTGESLFMTVFMNQGAGKSASLSVRLTLAKSSPSISANSAANSSRKKTHSSAPQKA